MSLTKRSPHFDALMEEARRYDELSHERYRESLYLESTKQPGETAHKTKQDESDSSKGDVQKGVQH